MGDKIRVQLLIYQGVISKLLFLNFEYVTLWWTNIAIENGHRNSGFMMIYVDFPIKNGGSFHSFLLVHQRVTHAFIAHVISEASPTSLGFAACSLHFRSCQVDTTGTGPAGDPYCYSSSLVIFGEDMAESNMNFWVNEITTSLFSRTLESWLMLGKSSPFMALINSGEWNMISFTQ